MPVLEKTMQKKEKDTCSKDETVSNYFWEKRLRIDGLTAFNAVN